MSRSRVTDVDTIPRRPALRLLRQVCIAPGVLVQAGIIPTSTNTVVAGSHRTWARPEAADLAKLYALLPPNDGALIESHQTAQDVAKAKA